MQYIVEKDALEDLLEDAIRLTVRDTVRELQKNGFLIIPEKDAYTQVSRGLEDYYNGVIHGEEDPEMKAAIESVRQDYYADIIPLFYYRHRTIEAIAAHYTCDPCTITRNKKRLCLRIYRHLRGE